MPTYAGGGGGGGGGGQSRPLILSDCEFFFCSQLSIVLYLFVALVVLL